MEVLFLHYHLNPGGVTKIIEAQINGLQMLVHPPDMKVICGNFNGTEKWNGITVCENDLMNYRSDSSMVKLSEDVTAIMSFIKSLGTRPILHCHNPNLGKNPAVSLAVYNLAHEGFPVINHCHDFAEDRPENIRLMEQTLPEIAPVKIEDVLYPDLPNYHFIVLNSCDKERILNKKIDPARIHFLANPVAKSKDYAASGLKDKIRNALSVEPSKKLCTYPVRAIKRKNLGEFILLATLFADVASFAVTMAPRNPAELPQYELWKSFCLKLNIPVCFEAGEIVPYEELIAASDFCVTTSIREGFGMVYLEPWLAGTPVIGRELPCVINDLKKTGMHFPGLYKRINVNFAGEQVDFMELSQHDQELYIREIQTENRIRQEMILNNPFLLDLLNDVPPEIIETNQQVIRQRFSIEAYGKEISGIYRKILA